MTTTLDRPDLSSQALLPFLDREHTIARPGYSRWMVPPAALCVHLCIGQAYAFSVFNLPMTRLLGITQSTPGDWKLTELGWIFWSPRPGSRPRLETTRCCGWPMLAPRAKQSASCRVGVTDPSLCYEHQDPPR